MENQTDTCSIDNCWNLGNNSNGLNGICQYHIENIKSGGESKNIQIIISDIQNMLDDSMNNYEIIAPIDSGAFSRVFLVKNIINNKKYAMKVNYVIFTGNMINRSNQKKYIDRIADMYKKEYNLLSKVLKNINNIIRVNEDVNIKYIKTKEYCICYFLTEYQGNTLDKYIESVNRNVSLKNIKHIGKQLINVIIQLHSKSVLYIDFNLENILYNKSTNKLTLIDFGLSIREGDWNNNIRVYGQQVFVQINGNIGEEPTKLGDIQSICYILMYLYLGYLPWYKDFNNSQKIASYKIALTRDEIFTKLPIFLQKLILHTYSYDTENEIPNYKKILEIIE